METNIVQYVHSKKKNRSGPLRAVIIAQVRPDNPNEVGIGWAMARRMSGIQIDQFSKSMGVKIASGRAANLSKEAAPHSLKEDIENVTQRAINYFKDKKVLPVTKFSEPTPKPVEDLSNTQGVAIRPLSTGTIIEYLGHKAEVIHDDGSENIDVYCDGIKQRWYWCFEGVECSVVSLPNKVK